MANGRTISDADRARTHGLPGALTRNRRRKKMLRDRTSESGRISDAERHRVEELLDYMEKNDGGSRKSPKETILI